jgi:hypothetical protein
MTGSAFFNRDDVLASKGNAARFFLSELPDVCPFSLPKEIQRRGVGTKEQVKLLCDGPWTASLRGQWSQQARLSQTRLRSGQTKPGQINSSGKLGRPGRVSGLIWIACQAFLILYSSHRYGGFCRMLIIFSGKMRAGHAARVSGQLNLI